MFRMRWPSLIVRALIVALCAFAIWRSARLAIADSFAATGSTRGYERAIALEPDDEGILAGRAIFLGESGDTSPAVDRALERAVAMNPLDSSALMTLGLRAELNGNTPRAERALAQAVEVDHTFKPLWTLANFYFRAGNTDKFWPLIERCLSMIERRERDVPSFDPAPIFDLAWNESADGKKIRKLIPTREATIVPYLAYLYNSRRTDAALEVWPEAARLADLSYPFDTGTLLGFCDYLIDANRTADAVKVWNELANRRVVQSNQLDPASGASVSDSAFRFPAIARGFSWRINHVPGTFVSEAPGAIRFELTGNEPEAFEMLWNFLPVLPDHSYRLTWRLDSSRLETSARADPGFRFFVEESQTSEEVCPPALAEGGKGECEFTTGPGVRRLRIGLRYRRATGTVRARGALVLSAVDLEPKP
jgi:tetratricopeptide (TPR) repeat protein